MRRGRGFNREEVANLRSWGVEPRPDEVEPEVSQETQLAAEAAAEQRRLAAYEASRTASELAADIRRRQADERRSMLEQVEHMWYGSGRV